MKPIIIRLKQHLNFSNFWVRNGSILVIISILSNHLFEPKNFPLNKNYSFPLFPIVVSIVAGIIILLIARINFNHYKEHHFNQNIDTHILIRFLGSTLGYITLLYLVLYFSLNGIMHGVDSYSVYHLLKGLSVSLLICAIGITLLFSVDIYKLHKHKTVKGVLKINQGGKITLVKFSEIAFIYSENKIVYLVKTDGTKISTEFTLNEIETKLSDQNFYRANRQTILHVRAIEQVKAIENRKLAVLLKPVFNNNDGVQINISRYKRQEFMNWFENKL